MIPTVYNNEKGFDKRAKSELYYLWYMRPALILFLSLLCSSAFAQDWQMFPPDSLRYYINPIQDSVYIQGVDYRQYIQYNDTTEIDLGWFARFDTIDNEYLMQIKTANSNFGRKVFETDEVTNILFVDSYDGSIKLGELIFSKIRKPAYKWQVYENKDIQIIGKIASVRTYGVSDSVCNIVLDVTRKSDDYHRTFLMQYSKKWGLIQSPVLYDIVSAFDKLSDLAEVQFHTYKEIKVDEFFAPEVGSEFHFKDDNSYKQSVIGKWKCLAVNNNIGRFNLTLEGVKYKWVSPNPPAPSTTRISERYRLNAKDLEMRLFNQIEYHFATDDSIANPIPSKFGYEKTYTNNNWVVPSCLVKCGKTWVFRDTDMHYAGKYQDTSFFYFYRNSGLFLEAIAQGIGEVKKHQYSPGPRGQSHIIDYHYIKTGSGCEIAKAPWRLTSIPEIDTEELSIYPNPASTQITISTSKPILKVEAVNISGQHVRTHTDHNIIDVSQLKPGVYYLNIETKAGTFTKKLLIQRD
jgi:hypothetical protein